MRELARLAEAYGSGELRVTVEQNVIIPDVPDGRVAALLEARGLKTRQKLAENSPKTR